MVTFAVNGTETGKLLVFQDLTDLQTVA